MAYTLETSLHLPLLRFTSELTYTIVEKPSGIAYMLLTLISEMKAKQTKLASLLETFKVPKDLHHIFAQELETLVELNMIKTKRSTYKKSNFKDYLVNAFTLTKEGKKAFAEKQILTDKKKQIRLKSFFDPITQSYLQNIENQFGTRQNSPLKEELYNKILPIKLEPYKKFIENTPNKKISSQLNETDKFNEALVPKESIEKLFVKYDIKMIIDKDNNVTIDFDDSKQNDFYKNHYDIETLEEAMYLKRKFKYYLEHNKLIYQLKDFKNIMSLDFPENIAQKLNQSSWIIVTQKDFVNNNKKGNLFEFDNAKELFKHLSILYQYIVGKKDRFIGYTLIKTQLKETSLNKEFELPILIETTLSGQESQQVVHYLFKTLSGMPLEEKLFKVIADMSTYQNDDTLKKDFLLDSIKRFKSNDLVIDFIRVNEKSLKKHFDWAWITNGIVENIYNQYMASLTLNNFIDNYNVLFTIKDLLNHNDKIFVEALTNSIALNNNDENIIFSDVLLNENINKKIISEWIGIDDIIIEIILNKKTLPGSSKLIQEYKVLSKLYNTLTEMINLKSNDEFDIPESLDLNVFTKQYEIYKDSFKKIDIKSLNSKNAKALQNQTAIMQEVVNLHNTEKQMSIDVKKLKIETIKNSFDQGNLFESTLMFHGRLEYILKELLDQNESLINLIDSAKKAKIIDKKSSDHLHTLRKYRNDIVHNLTSKNILNKEKMDKGFTILEALEAKYESKSND